VYLGHVAVALVLRSRAPNVPIVPLTLACYGPDWIDAALMLPTGREPMAIYSHSLPALVLGALASSGLYALVARRPGALQMFVAWLLHWPLDLFTGFKPVIRAQPQIGLDLYHVAWADALLESLVIVAACVIYARAVDSRRHRRVFVALGIVLVTTQVVFDVALKRLDSQPWHPLLAFAP